MMLFTVPKSPRQQKPRASRESMSDRVRSILLERIVDGTYPPGHRLIELDIADELGTSQAPVREALRELKALRVVDVEAYRGTRVREVTEQELRDALEVRAVLEHFAASIVSAHATLIAQLDAELEGMRAASEDSDAPRFARHDNRFHGHIVAATGNETLLRVWESLAVEARIRLVIAQPHIDLHAIVAHHEPIRDALGTGDNATAAQLLRHHPELAYKG